MRIVPCVPGAGRPARAARRAALRLALLLALLLASRGAATEPDEAPGEAPGPPVPIVTLDALPLGVPLERLSEAARGRAEAVLGESLFAQRVTDLRYRSRAEVFEFLLDHPDFAAGVARALRLGEYRVTALDGGYWGDDNRGARGMIRVLHAEEGLRLFHLEGEYDQRGLPTIAGQMLVLLEFRHVPDGAGGTVADVSLTGHLRVDTPLAGAVAVVVATLARPAVERAVERKVRRFFGTVARVSRWAYDQPEDLATALERHPEVPDDETLAAFRRILLADRPPLWATEPFGLLPPGAERLSVPRRRPRATSP
jgi:hypothetical protein